MTTHDLVNQAIAIIADFTDIQKREKRYADRDEVNWKKHDFPKLADILDELYNLTNPEYANQINMMLGQEELVHELGATA